MFSIWESSPRAQAKIKSFDDAIGVSPPTAQTKYPFQQLNIGKSFAVPFTDVKEQVIRNAASLAGKNGKRFIVIKHTTGDAFEVARIV